MGRSPPIADTRARRQKPGQPCRANPSHRANDMFCLPVAYWRRTQPGRVCSQPPGWRQAAWLLRLSACPSPWFFFHTPPGRASMGLSYPLLGAQQFSGSAEVALSYEDIYRIYRIYRIYHIYHIYRTLWCPCVRFAWLVTGFAFSVTSFAFCVTDFAFGVRGSVVSTVLTKTRFA